MAESHTCIYIVLLQYCYIADKEVLFSNKAIEQFNYIALS
jgi:hypothetical protein